MDKWDEFTSRIKNSILAEEPEAAVAAAFDYMAEFGRTIEQMGADVARIADALQPNVEVAEDPGQGKFDL